MEVDFKWVVELLLNVCLIGFYGFGGFVVVVLDGYYKFVCIGILCVYNSDYDM